MILDATLEYRVCILVSLLNRDNFSTEYFINVITAGPLGAEGPGQLPPLLPHLIRPCMLYCSGVAMFMSHGADH